MEENEENEILTEEIMFIILNLTFFISLLVFIINSSDIFYQQSYAKKIALLIDSAKSDTEITIDITKLANIAKKYNRDIKDIIEIDNQNKKVIVKVKDEYGYSFPFFSSFNVKKMIEDDKLKIIIKNEE